MKFNTYPALEGLHAFLSPSKYHWINYDEEKLDASYIRAKAVERGVRLHALADECIQMGVKLPKSKKTLNMFVNDAIGFKMQTEQILYYSENSFGTADAISFKNGLLRIHDLKTGITPASMKQLEVYMALFCLEYSKSPNDIHAELRLYQNDEIIIHEPHPDDILFIMDRIVYFDKRIEHIKSEG